MSTSELNASGFSAVTHSPAPSLGGSRTLHRLQAVRQEQGLSVRRVAQQMKLDAEDVRQEEDPQSDLPLSRLYAWQRVLEVPIADLLVDSDSPLSAPVLERARLVKLMKSVAGILEKTRDPDVKKLAESMAEQLKEIMPELAGVTAWPTTSQRRQAVRMGRIAQHTYSFELRAD